VVGDAPCRDMGVGVGWGGVDEGIARMHGLHCCSRDARFARYGCSTYDDDDEKRVKKKEPQAFLYRSHCTPVCNKITSIDSTTYFNNYYSLLNIVQVQNTT